MGQDTFFNTKKTGRDLSFITIHKRNLLLLGIYSAGIIFYKFETGERFKIASANNIKILFRIK